MPNDFFHHMTTPWICDLERGICVFDFRIHSNKPTGAISSDKIARTVAGPLVRILSMDRSYLIRTGSSIHTGGRLGPDAEGGIFYLYNKKMDALGGGGTKRSQSLQFIAFPGKNLGTRLPSCLSLVYFHASLHRAVGRNGVIGKRPGWNGIRDSPPRLRRPINPWNLPASPMIEANPIASNGG